jgi:hypothetical protein
MCAYVWTALLLLSFLVTVGVSCVSAQDLDSEPVIECIPPEQVEIPAVLAKSFTSRVEITKGRTSWANSFAFQLGANGFFGPYNIDNGFSPVPPVHAIGDFASVNGWFGGSVVSGASSATSRLFTTVEPTVKLTPAVNIKSAYLIGPYTTGTAPGIGSPISTGFR